MNRLEAITLIVKNLWETDLVVHANGAISRESCFCKNRSRNFYLLGSMGLASSVGLGLALKNRNNRVIILDGDGNILMGLGNMAMIGALKPGNLTHIILDNHVYGTTGNQPTLSSRLSLSQMAKAAGYRRSCCINSGSGLEETLSRISPETGPHFIQIKVDHRVTRDCPRLPFSAREIKERFLNSL